MLKFTILDMRVRCSGPQKACWTREVKSSDDFLNSYDAATSLIQETLPIPFLPLALPPSTFSLSVLLCHAISCIYIFSEDTNRALWTCGHTQQKPTSFIPSKRSDFYVAVMAREARITSRLSQHDTRRHACQPTSPIHSSDPLTLSSPQQTHLNFTTPCLTSGPPAAFVLSIGTIPHHRTVHRPPALIRVCRCAFTTSPFFLSSI